MKGANKWINKMNQLILEGLRQRIINDAAKNDAISHPLFVPKEPSWIRHYQCSSQDKSHRFQIIKALTGDANKYDAYNIGLRIDDCTKSKRCQCPFCPFCRKNFQENAVKTTLPLFINVPIEHLRFLTILLPVSYFPKTEAQNQIHQYTQQIRNILNGGFNDVRMYGFYEVDVKRPSLVKHRPRSKEVLTKLGMDLTLNDDAYLLHLHALVDIGKHSKDDIRDALTNRVFDNPYQVRINQLHSTKTKKDNIINITNYMLKFRLQFADNLYGNQQEGKVMYGSLYEDELLRSNVCLISSLMGNNRISSLGFRYNC